jgi:putative FmdB family regulatory protein
MPIYEYACEKCGAAFEKLVPGHATRVACPECRSPKVTRQLSAFAVRSHGGAAAGAAAAGGRAAAACCGGG